MFNVSLMVERTVHDGGKRTGGGKKEEEEEEEVDTGESAISA